MSCPAATLRARSAGWFALGSGWAIATEGRGGNSFSYSREHTAMVLRATGRAAVVAFAMVGGGEGCLERNGKAAPEPCGPREAGKQHPTEGYDRGRGYLHVPRYLTPLQVWSWSTKADWLPGPLWRSYKWLEGMGVAGGEGWGPALCRGDR